MSSKPPLLFPPFAMGAWFIAVAMCLGVVVGEAVHAIPAQTAAAEQAVKSVAGNAEEEDSPMPIGAEWWVQLGFIGAFIVAMWIMFWLIKARRLDWQTWMKTLVEQNRETGQALQNNTAAFVQLNGTLAKLCEKLTSEEAYSHKVYEALMQRPCLIATVGSKRASKLLADLHKELSKDEPQSEDAERR